MSEEKHPALGIDQTFFLIITTPVKPREEVVKHMPAHLERQMQLERDGILFAAGPLFEEGGEVPAAGCIVVRAKDFAEAKKIADADPMHSSGTRSYTLHRWKINEGSFQVKFTYSDHVSTVS